MITFTGSHFVLYLALQLVCFVFPIEVPGELNSLYSQKLCVHMHVNKTKFYWIQMYRRGRDSGFPNRPTPFK